MIRRNILMAWVVAVVAAVAVAAAAVAQVGLRTPCIA